MKYLGKITDPKDLVTKEYVDQHGGSVDSTDVPTADKVAEFDSTAHMNSTDMTSAEVDAFVANLSAMSVLLDTFYPVGTIYPTRKSPLEFDPNTAWGGTWVQIQDKFLLGSGTTYPSGSADGGEATVRLSDQNMAHGHGFTQPSVSGGAGTNNITGGSHDHQMANSTLVYTTVSGTSKHAASGSAYNWDLNTTPKIHTWTQTHTHSLPAHTHTVSGGAVANLSGADSTRTAHNNMPPYTVITYWERTA